VRWATLLVVITLGACDDVRDFRGAWHGSRAGVAAPLRVGAGDAATLELDELDTRGLAGRLTLDGLGGEAALASIPGAEADVLATVSFAGSPLRTYLTYAALGDGGGDALVVVALYDDDHVELRVLRSGPVPLYAIYVMRR
jgi:hypothetical protein